MPVFRDLWQTNRTAENGLISGKGATVLTFLWRAQAQSGFNASIRRMQCDQRPASRPSRVDFCKHLRESGWGLRRNLAERKCCRFCSPRPTSFVQRHYWEKRSLQIVARQLIRISALSYRQPTENCVTSSQART
jgi:hypothetical protein